MLFLGDDLWRQGDGLLLGDNLWAWGVTLLLGDGRSRLDDDLLGLGDSLLLRWPLFDRDADLLRLGGDLCCLGDTLPLRGDDLPLLAGRPGDDLPLLDDDPSPRGVTLLLRDGALPCRSRRGEAFPPAPLPGERRAPRAGGRGGVRLRPWGGLPRLLSAERLPLPPGSAEPPPRAGERDPRLSAQREESRSLWRAGEGGANWGRGRWAGETSGELSLLLLPAL